MEPVFALTAENSSRLRAVSAAKQWTNDQTINRAFEEWFQDTGVGYLERATGMRADDYPEPLSARKLMRQNISPGKLFVAASR